MAIIKIRSQPIDVNVRYELEQFPWINGKWSGGKLLAPSPFRYDKTPSFFVSLDGDYAGAWKDSGAYDAEYESGNFTTLLAYLRNETTEETEEYLLHAYKTDYSDGIKLNFPNLRLAENMRYLDRSVLVCYAYRHRYLETRGISEAVQRYNKIGYDRSRQAIVIPWFAANGQLANIKYRSIRGKTFWYEKGAVPIRDLVWGIHRARPTTVLCEAEIDAMSWQMAGYSAIAVGGASFNDKKRDLIIRSNIEELIIATDNDKMGAKLREEVTKSLNGYVRVRQAHVATVKDVNEILIKGGGVAKLKEMAEKAESSGGLRLKIR
ncbi:toprim domain-containing protein [Gottfriedia sp. S16(2024)]|uniref:toprim domain-containing protein n=1 Tax=Gottfriedia sp. S16(2024) TaxID=3162883 RepID=UPI003D1F1882